MRIHYPFARVLLPILILIAALAGGCASDRAVISQANDAHAGLQPAVMHDPQLNAYLQAVGNRILTTARDLDHQHYGPDSHREEDSAWMFSNQMQFHFVNSKTLNAFTTGGEHMYIYSELFQQCGSEDELAAVMSHEFAHVYCRHVHKGMNRQMGIAGLSLGAGALGYAVASNNNRTEYAASFASAAAVTGQFVGMGFTREDEAEADQIGFAIYARSGWAPEHFGDFFQHMIDKGYDKTPALLSDHPSLAGRVQASKQYAAALPPSAAQWRCPPVADASRFAQLKALSIQAGRTMPTDAKLQSAQQLLSAFPSCVSSQDHPDQKAAQKRLRTYLNRSR